MDAARFQTQLSHTQIGRICVIKPSAFGDVVQSMPLLNALRARFPASQISWVINRELGDLLSGHASEVQQIPFDRRGGLSTWMRLLSDIRRARFDLVFDLQGLFRTGAMSLFSRAPLRVGLESAREGSSLACHYLVPDSSHDVPAHRRYWRIAEDLGVGDLAQRADIAVPQADQSWALRLKSQLSGPLVVVHPGARWKTKLWPISHFSHVLQRATHELGMSAIVVGSQGESSKADELVRSVKRQVPHSEISSLAGKTSMKQLAALMQQADLVLSNDSGPMHLAAAMGAPVVGIFTCTSPERSGPPGLQHRLVAANVPCAASYCKICPHQGARHLACFQELTPAKVWAAFYDHWKMLMRPRRSA